MVKLRRRPNLQRTAAIDQSKADLSLCLVLNIQPIDKFASVERQGLESWSPLKRTHTSQISTIYKFHEWPLRTR